MVRLFVRYLAIMLGAALIGFAAVHYAVYKTAPWTRDTKLTLSVAIRGTQGQPVTDSELILYAPEKRVIGRTNERGEFKDTFNVARGKIAILEAQGPTYKIRKEIAIPRNATFVADVRLDPREAQLGHMTLISKTLEEMSRNLGGATVRRKTKPKPTLALATPAPSPLPAVATPAPKPTSWLVVEAADESPRAEHDMEAIIGLAKVLVEDLKENLMSAGVTKIKVRPLISMSAPYFEMVGYNARGIIVGSSLVNGAKLEPITVRAAVAALVRKNVENANIAGKLVVYAAQPQKARAYLNGLALKGVPFQDRSEFLIPKYNTRATHVALAVTADKRPLIRKIALREAMERVIVWTLPEPGLSQR